MGKILRILSLAPVEGWEAVTGLLRFPMAAWRDLSLAQPLKEHCVLGWGEMGPLHTYLDKRLNW